MTLREYIKNNIDDFVYALCQQSQCDNCPIGCSESCVLRREEDFPLDAPMNKQECDHLGVFYDDAEADK